jgi:hypothetical protein
MSPAPVSPKADEERQNGKANCNHEFSPSRTGSTASCSDAEIPESERLDSAVIRSPSQAGGHPATDGATVKKTSGQRAKLALFCRTTAHTDFDFDLVWSCCEMLNITDVVDSEFICGCLKMLSMLHDCEYSVDVTMMTLAVAVMYGEDGSVLRAFDDGSSRGLTVFCMYAFLAHTYLVDEYAFLETWSDYVFRDVCDVQTLNRHIVAFLRERKSCLGVDAAAAEAAYSTLFCALQRTTTGLQVVNEIVSDTISSPIIAAHSCE